MTIMALETQISAGVFCICCSILVMVVHGANSSSRIYSFIIADLSFTVDCFGQILGDVEDTACSSFSVT